MPQAIFKAGTSNLPFWEALLEPVSRLRGVDTLNAIYRTAATTTLSVGDAVPGYSGMIITELQQQHTGGSIRWFITAEGSFSGTNPTKILSRSTRRTLNVGWDEMRVETISWYADWMDCTAVAATDVITTTSAHGYSTGQAVVFARLTGGAGITPQSAGNLGVIVYVYRIDSTTFKVSDTYAHALAGTNFVNITTNMTAGQVIAAEFALGSPHPSFPYMYLMDVELQDDYTSWKRASVVYMGLKEDKPYKRMIKCNGQAMSSSTPIYWDFTDGSLSLERRAVNLPQIVVEDTYLTLTALATDTVPLSQGEGATPPSAPSVRTVVITGTVDEVVYQWPNGWSRMAVAHGDTLNSLLAPNITVITSEYRWPVLLN